MKQLNIHVTEQQFDRLKAQSEESGLSVAEIVRRILDAQKETH